jgi:predicted porin
VYGIMDMGIAGGNARVQGSTVSKGTAFGVAQSAQSTSRLGFRGTEDLGGGTSAFFTVEIGLTPDASSVISTSATSNRQSFVGLAQKGVGRFALGTQLTPIAEAVSITDPGANNNIVGNVIYPITGNGGATYSSANPYGMSSGMSYSQRQANALTLKSENIAGFTARAILTAKNGDTTQTSTAAGTTAGSGGQNDASGYGLGLDYKWNKLFLTANYQAFTAESNTAIIGNATTAPTFVLTSAGQANAAGSNVNDNQMYVGGMYDFGILTAYAGYINRKVEANNNTAYFSRYTAQQIGVRSNLTKTIQAWASVGTGAYEAAGYDLPSANINGYQLGANYILSKRTNLYGIFGNASQSVAANNAASPAAARNTSYNVNNYAVGVRHTF